MRLRGKILDVDPLTKEERALYNFNRKLDVLKLAKEY